MFLCVGKSSLYVHRLLVERVFAQYMVPHNLETAERMKCLYYLYATLDTNAVKYVPDVLLSNSLTFVDLRVSELKYFLGPFRALNEMWKCQNLLRQHVKDLLELIKKPKVADWSTRWITAVLTRRRPQFLTVFPLSTV